MEEGGEEREVVVSRARVCEVLVQEGHVASMDANGNVVVRFPHALCNRSVAMRHEHLVEERRMLAAWRKSVHGERPRCRGVRGSR